MGRYNYLTTSICKVVKDILKIISGSLTRMRSTMEPISFLVHQKMQLNCDKGDSFLLASYSLLLHYNNLSTSFLL